MTALPREPDSIGGVNRACVSAVDGRRAARALSAWCARFAVSEPEFQVLWCLRGRASGGLDQTIIAKLLAYSPAQISATVERLRAKGWIVQQAADGDRRRNVWHLSSAGRDTLTAMLCAAHDLRWDVPRIIEQIAITASRQEAA